MRDVIAVWRSQRRVRWFCVAQAQGALGDGAGYATPLAPALLGIHRRLRESFDPHGVFVPGRPMRFQA